MTDFARKHGKLPSSIINRVYRTDAVANWKLDMYTPEMQTVAYGSTR